VGPAETQAAGGLRLRFSTFWGFLAAIPDRFLTCISYHVPSSRAVYPFLGLPRPEAGIFALDAAADADLEYLVFVPGSCRDAPWRGRTGQNDR
jgi:hypothetical protein